MLSSSSGWVGEDEDDAPSSTVVVECDALIQDADGAKELWFAPGER